MGLMATRREGSINMPYGVRIQRDCNQMKLAEDSQSTSQSTGGRWYEIQHSVNITTHEDLNSIFPGSNPGVVTFINN